jgi:hypothetical protein
MFNSETISCRFPKFAKTPHVVNLQVETPVVAKHQNPKSLVGATFVAM